MDIKNNDENNLLNETDVLEYVRKILIIKNYNISKISDFNFDFNKKQIFTNFLASLYQNNLYFHPYNNYDLNIDLKPRDGNLNIIRLLKAYEANKNNNRRIYCSGIKPSSDNNTAFIFKDDKLNLISFPELDNKLDINYDVFENLNYNLLDIDVRGTLYSLIFLKHYKHILPFLNSSDISYIKNNFLNHYQILNNQNNDLSYIDKDDENNIDSPNDYTRNILSGNDTKKQFYYLLAEELKAPQNQNHELKILVFSQILKYILSSHQFKNKLPIQFIRPEDSFFKNLAKNDTFNLIKNGNDLDDNISITSEVSNLSEVSNVPIIPNPINALGESSTYAPTNTAKQYSYQTSKQVTKQNTTDTNSSNNLYKLLKEANVNSLIVTNQDVTEICNKLKLDIYSITEEKEDYISSYFEPYIDHVFIESEYKYALKNLQEMFKSSNITIITTDTNTKILTVALKKQYKLIFIKLFIKFFLKVFTTFNCKKEMLDSITNIINFTVMLGNRFTPVHNKLLNHNQTKLTWDFEKKIYLDRIIDQYIGGISIEVENSDIKIANCSESDIIKYLFFMDFCLNVNSFTEVEDDFYLSNIIKDNISSIDELFNNTNDLTQYWTRGLPVNKVNDKKILIAMINNFFHIRYSKDGDIIYILPIFLSDTNILYNTLVDYKLQILNQYDSDINTPENLELLSKHIKSYQLNKLKISFKEEFDNKKTLLFLLYDEKSDEIQTQPSTSTTEENNDSDNYAGKLNFLIIILKKIGFSIEERVLSNGIEITITPSLTSDNVKTLLKKIYENVEVDPNEVYQGFEDLFKIFYDKTSGGGKNIGKTSIFVSNDNSNLKSLMIEEGLNNLNSFKEQEESMLNNKNLIVFSKETQSFLNRITELDKKQLLTEETLFNILPYSLKTEVFLFKDIDFEDIFLPNTKGGAVDYNDIFNELLNQGTTPTFTDEEIKKSINKTLNNSNFNLAENYSYLVGMKDDVRTDCNIKIFECLFQNIIRIKNIWGVEFDDKILSFLMSWYLYEMGVKNMLFIFLLIINYIKSINEILYKSVPQLKTDIFNKSFPVSAFKLIYQKLESKINQYSLTKEKYAKSILSKFIKQADIQNKETPKINLFLSPVEFEGLIMDNRMFKIT